MKAANSAANKKVASSPTDADALPFSPDSVDKIMTTIELLFTKIDSQTAALRHEIVSIGRDLHTTVSSLQSTNARCAKHIDDLEQPTIEWTSKVMTLETTVKRPQSKVCHLTESRHQNIHLIGIEQGEEGTVPTTVLHRCAE